MDAHLNFFWRKCDMCEVHYDVIGKVETSQVDINYVSHKVNDKSNKTALDFCSKVGLIFSEKKNILMIKKIFGTLG